MNISIFTIPKAFRDYSRVHQSNAIASWLHLPTQPEIILCGNDPGVASAAESFGVQHLPHIRCTAQGTPLLDDAFAQVHACARGSVLVYVNADIMLMPDFVSAIQQVSQQHSEFLMLGRRWNLDVEALINFDQAEWRSQLLTRLGQYGIFGGIGALDYFVFPKPMFNQLPPFAVGRAGWDSWMVGEALKQNYPVINASQRATVIHQNHDYNHLPGKRLEAFHGSEARQNRTFLKGHFAGSSANATHVLQPAATEGAKKPRVTVVLAHRNSSDAPKQREMALRRIIAHLKLQTTADIQVVGVNQPLSTVAAWNKGVTQTQGEFVLFLDTATQLLPNALSAWLAQIDTRAGSLEMSLAGWQSTKKRSDSPAADTIVAPWQQLEPLLNGREGIQGLHIWSLPAVWPLLHPSSVLFRRDWLERFGTLNESLQPHSAVIDLVLRLFSRGAAAVYLEESVLRTRVQPNSYLDRRAIATTAQDCRQILESFFQQPHLPAWSYPLEQHAKRTVAAWLEQSASAHDETTQPLR